MQLSTLARSAAYENGVRRVSPNTYDGIYKTTQNRMLDFFGDVELDDLRPAHIAAWCEHLEESALSVPTANTYKRTAKAMLNRVGYRHLTGPIVQRKAPRQKSKAMTEAHFMEMVRHANVRDAAILWLLRDSGRRRATICQLKVRDTHIYQGEGGDWRLVNSYVIEKGMTPVITLGGPEAALAVTLWLRCRPAPSSPYLFTHLKNGAPLRPQTITDLFTRLRQAANLPHGVPTGAHSLRHWFAQRRLEEHDAKLVSQWMGITVETVLKVYAHRSEEELIRLFFAENGERTTID